MNSFLRLNILYNSLDRNEGHATIVISIGSDGRNLSKAKKRFRYVHFYGTLTMHPIYLTPLFDELAISGVLPHLYT
jgi:hypothetical protein